MPSVSFLCKRKARLALSGHWQTALLIALIVNLPSLLINAVSVFTQRDLASLVLLAQENSVNASGILDVNLLYRNMENLMRSPSTWLFPGLSLLAGLLVPFLTLGMLNWLLTLLRTGKDDGILTVFSRRSLFLKAIGLRFFTAFRVFLWTLPAVALLFLSLLPVAGQPGPSGTVLASPVLGPVWMLALIIPAFMAYLRYALAEWFMTEHPDTGILEAFRQSKSVMSSRKAQLFSLMLSFIGWYLLISLLSTMAGGVISLMLQLLGSLALSVYMNASVGVFYLALTRSPENPADTLFNASSGERDSGSDSDKDIGDS